MIIDGTKITENRLFMFDTIREIKNKGEKLLRNSPVQVDKTEQALIIAAKYALQLEKSAKNVKTYKMKMPIRDAAILTHPAYISLGAMGDYLKNRDTSNDKESLKRTIADKVASAVFFLMWNSCNAEFYQENDSDEWKYDTIMYMDYGFDIATGEKHFKRMGFNVVNPHDQNDIEYYDALAIAKNFVKNDMIEVGENVVIDMPYFAYRVNKEFDRCSHYQGEPEEEPTPIKQEMKNGFNQHFDN